MSEGGLILETLFWLLLCLFFVGMSGLFSGCETGLYCVNQLRLRLAAHGGDKSAIKLRALLEDSPGLLFTTLLGTNVANYMAPVCLTVIFLAASSTEMASDVRATIEQRAELFTTLILTPIVFIFGEIVPKNVFQRQADALMLRVAPVLSISHRVFQLTGLVRLQRTFSSLVINLVQRQPTSGSAFHPRQQMFQMLREGAAEGTLSHTQLSMLERIHALHATRVSTVMIPASQVIMLSADATKADVEATLRMSPYSRMPIYRPGDRRHVIGVVHVLDLLLSSGDTRVTKHRRPPIEVSSDLNVMDALTALQQERRRLAIVVDLMGRCVGIVTLKDLVEEIVGDLPAW